MKWSLYLSVLVLGCAGASVGYVPPAANVNPPFSAPAPVDQWACTCNLRCQDGHSQKATATVLRYRGVRPDPDGCSEVNSALWKEACGSTTPGECLGCSPWETSPAKPAN